MKITWGTALPLFVESNWEYIEIDLAESYGDLEKLREILNQELPNQARILKVAEVFPDDRSSISDILESLYLAKLIQIKRADTPSIDLKFSQTGILIGQEMIGSFLGQEKINVTRLSKGKEKIVDIKPLIVDMRLIDENTLELNLRKSQRASEVLETFLSGSKWSIRKVSQTLN
jgi:uncharacterized protein (DUF2344 family)